ncbi:PTS system N-acetylglucosamine-specific IIB component, Glc family (TC 4.A.1.1.7)/PTS system N-acetylglucosamine-specific IIC component, Glc family (TC 4.A.1.1.7) [Paenibacillus sp. yr247]|nr:PTS system N-acetylglucosamine-specific IIB component, Glc family (TC 4.A.1.1.7)/PTS system N-acetylglucosamine-specific IIC component, Glc family (TC 4.A.1.1.7) [Paenibacillus sp. yr247]
MIPIAVLPAASILLRIGKMTFSDPFLMQVAQIFESGGSAIFDNLPFIFAIGIAIGLTSGDGIAALAAAVGYLVFDNVLKHFQTGTDSADQLDMGVLGGMLVGVLSAAFFNRFQHIRLPKALGFFGGKRFVPLITSLVMVFLGVLMGFIWPPVQRGISVIGLWIVDNGNIGVFIYGIMNRLLIPTGLHHIINNIAWFQIGDFSTPTGKIVHGDISRFFAGDPEAGMFMTGYYPVIMFGLPAAALALIRSASPSNRQLVVPVMLSAGLTSFLTGVTEPIEFTFMFVAPGLYVIHALLTGFSMLIMNILQVKMGFGFSAGFIDFVLNWHVSTKPYWILIVGIGYFILYYLTFRVYLHYFPVKVSSRDDTAQLETEEVTGAIETKEDRPSSILRHIGGPSNIISIDACITRLRLLVNEENLIMDSELKELGAIGVIRLGKGNVHVVFGTESEQIRESIKPMLVDTQKDKSGRALERGGVL